MIRRRKPVREENFSFDSFLDLVTNVVGIIIRLILVVWVGGRSYSSLPDALKQDSKAAVVKALPLDPLQDELARQRQELAKAKEKLLEELSRLQVLTDEEKKTEQSLTALSTSKETIEKTRADIDRAKTDKAKDAEKIVLSLGELQKRRLQLAEEMKKLEVAPTNKKAIRYRTPVSQPVHSHELHFECLNGKVSYINMEALIAQVRYGMEEKGKLLKEQWEVSDLTEPVGAFQLRYIIERQRDRLDSAFQTSRPEANGNFGYGLSAWQVVPVTPIRGELTDVALGNGSEFRHALDGLSGEQAVATFWVYPDSFPIYRALRDYLQDRGVTVAGRPLPVGVSIAFSKHGTISRGQ